MSEWFGPLVNVRGDGDGAHVNFSTRAGTSEEPGDGSDGRNVQTSEKVTLFAAAAAVPLPFCCSGLLLWLLLVVLMSGASTARSSLFLSVRSTRSSNGSTATQLDIRRGGVTKNKKKYNGLHTCNLCFFLWLECTHLIEKNTSPLPPQPHPLSHPSYSTSRYSSYTTIAAQLPESRVRHSLRVIAPSNVR